MDHGQPDRHLLQRLLVIVRRLTLLTAAQIGLVTALAMPATVKSEPVPTIFEAVNIQGNQGNDSVIVASVVYVFHDGSFDAFNLGAKASPGLTALATGQSAAILRDEILAVAPDAHVSRVVHGLCTPAPEFQEYHARAQDLDSVKHRYLSYFAAVFPSDDAFVGNDNPRQYEVFDESGVFQGPVVIELSGDDVLDAGVRINDETDIGAFDRINSSDFGIAEDEVIRKHPGFNGSVRNPQGQPVRVLGGTAQYANGGETWDENHCQSLHRVDPVLGDFTRPNFRLNRFRLTSRLSSYFSGIWYNPQTAGEGFVVQIFDAVTPKLTLAWFTYEPDGSGRQKWLYGSGPIDYFSAEVELFETEGGIMGSIENPQLVQSRRWGTAEVGFGNCGAGGVIVEPDDPEAARGLIPFQRLTPVPAGLERDCGNYTIATPNAPPPF